MSWVYYASVVNSTQPYQEDKQTTENKQKTMT